MMVSIIRYGRMTQKRSPMMKLHIYSTNADKRPWSVAPSTGANCWLSISMAGGDGGGDAKSYLYKMLAHGMYMCRLRFKIVLPTWPATTS